MWVPSITITTITYLSITDYEQQRLHLLHKYGIDLDDSNALGDGKRTKRLDRREVEMLMGGDGQGGIFTWREKNRRKASRSSDFQCNVRSNVYSS